MELGHEFQGFLKRILQQDPNLASPSAAPATALPSGTLTFLLTDIEDSTEKWERHHEAMGQAMSLRDEILERRIKAHGRAPGAGGRRGASRPGALPPSHGTRSAACGVHRAG